MLSGRFLRRCAPQKIAGCAQSAAPRCLRAKPDLNWYPFPYKTRPQPQRTEPEQRNPYLNQTLTGLKTVLQMGFQFRLSTHGGIPAGLANAIPDLAGARLALCEFLGFFYFIVFFLGWSAIPAFCPGLHIFSLFAHFFAACF